MMGVRAATQKNQSSDLPAVRQMPLPLLIDSSIPPVCRQAGKGPVCKNEYLRQDNNQ
jgi:hypothetical protein